MRKSILALCAILTFLLAACGDTGSVPTATPIPAAATSTAVPPVPTNTVEPAATNTSAAPAATDTAPAGTPTEAGLPATSTSAGDTDATGAPIMLQGPPKRIACLVALCEDILFELGMQPVAVNDTFGQNPKLWGDAAKSFAQIGGTFPAPNVEDIAKAQPDLVIGFIPHAGLRDALAPIAPLLILNPTSYQDSINELKMIGRLTRHTAQADAAAQRLLDKIAAYKAKAPNDKVPLLIFGSTANFSIFTSGSLFGSVLAAVTNYPWPAPTAGQVGSADQEPGSLQYSLEKVLQKDPDVLLIESFPGAQPLSQQLAANPVWSQLKAVKAGQVYEVPTDIYLFGRGTRSLGLALDDAMTKIYPQTFPTPLP